MARLKSILPDVRVCVADSETQFAVTVQDIIATSTIMNINKLK